MTVRVARVEDAPSIARVHVDSRRTTYEGIYPPAVLNRFSVEDRERMWSEILASAGPESITLVGCDAHGEMAGFASGGAERTGRLGCDGELYAIYLLQTAQRQGLGSLLVNQFVGELRARGFGSMAVWVLAQNPFRKFYEALGGTEIAEREIELGGQRFAEVAYAWADLRTWRDGKASLPDAGTGEPE